MTSPLKEKDQNSTEESSVGTHEARSRHRDRPALRKREDDIDPKDLSRDRQYLVIVPLLSEVERFIREASVPFATPQVGEGFSTKTDA